MPRWLKGTSVYRRRNGGGSAIRPSSKNTSQRKRVEELCDDGLADRGYPGKHHRGFRYPGSRVAFHLHKRASVAPYTKSRGRRAAGSRARIFWGRLLGGVPRGRGHDDLRQVPRGHARTGDRTVRNALPGERCLVGSEHPPLGGGLVRLLSRHHRAQAGGGVTPLSRLLAGEHRRRGPRLRRACRSDCLEQRCREDVWMEGRGGAGSRCLRSYSVQGLQRRATGGGPPEAGRDGMAAHRSDLVPQGWRRSMPKR
jgi:hypothetical protein